ncbi:MAG: adenosylcobinamide amidohydrolase [Halomonas sp.]|nr:adenosylcobinamide amidohydrolase [Halomonas sp.]MDN6296490.1 adenosylcobinamide amidohydrolase [Halomonas sp.]MDN6313843.1 adenosylcobinamide amidohydrolase [Halomonas sp.]MDN6335297.1 adenosylcobinamide amidohydrolase [Halomonas sp.]
MPSADDNARAVRLAFSAGLVGRFSRGCIHLRADAPLATLSSALVGGGPGTARDFCNFYVDKDYAGRAPADDLARWLAGHEVDSSCAVAMMTAVKLEYAAMHSTPLGQRQNAVLALATAGSGNAVDIAAEGEDPRLVVGTVNVFVFIDAQLTPGAMVNACLSATEAKVAALRDERVIDAHSRTPATGTSTDCVSIAATQRGAPTPYAGSGTELGRAIGRTVYRTVRESLRAGSDEERGR